MARPSGMAWVALYPTSTSTDDLAPAFRSNAERFIQALRAAGATVTISATLRPPERAHLMHYAFRIAREQFDPREVPAMAGVDIEWVHRNAAGAPDLVRSRQAATEMVLGYGIVFQPSLTSRHTEGRAIDMTISHILNRRMNNARGVAVTPHTDEELYAIGATYAVQKLRSDPPHWSDDGH